MPRSWIHVALMALALAACGGCSRSSQEAKPGAHTKPADVDGARIVNADREPGNWMSHGRTYNEQRFSPLKAIDDRNIAQLGLA